MTASEVILLASELMGAEDVVNAIEERNNMLQNGLEYKFNDSMQKKINKLIKCINFTTDRIATNYINIKKVQSFVSDAEGKIAYSDFLGGVVDIEYVWDYSTSNDLDFKVLPFHLYVGLPNRKVSACYKFVPDEIDDLDEEIVMPPFVTTRILALGVVSDYLLSKNVYDESKYWNERFEGALIGAVSKRHSSYVAKRKFM